MFRTSMPWFHASMPWPRTLAAVTALSALTLTLAGCGGSSSGGSTPITPPVIPPTVPGITTNAQLRSAALLSTHGLYALLGGLFLFSDVPQEDPQAIAHHAPIVRLFRLPGLHPYALSPRASMLTFNPAINLYDSTTLSGKNFQFNFFSDAAGTSPAGSAQLTLPATFTVYPNVTAVHFNLTGGFFPATGDATITRMMPPAGVFADDYTIAGTLHLNNDKADAQYNVGSTTDAAANTTFFGTFLVNSGNNQSIHISNVTQDASGDNLSATVAVNPDQAGSFSGPLTAGTAGLKIHLTSGTKVFDASLTLADANGNLIAHPTLHLVYPDGTQQDVADAIITPAQ